MAGRRIEARLATADDLSRLRGLVAAVRAVTDDLTARLAAVEALAGAGRDRLQNHETRLRAIETKAAAK